MNVLQFISQRVPHESVRSRHRSEIYWDLFAVEREYALVCVRVRDSCSLCLRREHKTDEWWRNETSRNRTDCFGYDEWQFSHRFRSLICTDFAFVGTIKWPRYFIHLAIRSAASLSLSLLQQILGVLSSRWRRRWRHRDMNTIYNHK